MKFLKIRRHSKFYVDIKKKTIQIPGVVRLSDGMPINGVKYIHIPKWSEKKLEHVDSCSELLTVQIFKFLFVYGIGPNPQ